MRLEIKYSAHAMINPAYARESVAVDHCKLTGFILVHSHFVETLIVIIDGDDGDNNDITVTNKYYDNNDDILFKIVAAIIMIRIVVRRKIIIIMILHQVIIVVTDGPLWKKQLHSRCLILGRWVWNGYWLNLNIILDLILL